MELAELIWHLAEVQYFWATIVEDLLQDPDDVPPLERPETGALPEAFDEQSKRLLNALTRRDPEEICWSWHDDGHSVGWVRRRQAHEALIHRVDAQLATGSLSPVDGELAADGVDEILRVSIDLDSLPPWATFEADHTSARVEASDGSPAWSMNFGRFIGSSPISGSSGRRRSWATDFPGMALWRERLFSVMHRNASSAGTFFNLPHDQVVEVGIQVAI